MKDRGTDFIFVKFRAPVVHQDVLWPQLRKLEKRLVNILRDEDFQILRSDSWSDGIKCIIVFELFSKKLPKIKRREGPSIFDVDGTKGFLKRYENYKIFVYDNKWVSEYPRRYMIATDLLKDFLNKEYDVLVEEGVPRNMAKEIVEKVEVVDGIGVSRYVKMYGEFRKFLDKYFDKNLV